MIAPGILDQLRAVAGSLIPDSTLTLLIERYEEIRPGRAVCVWGHPFVPENTYIQPSTGWRICRHCRVCRARGVRAGQGLPEYYERHPEVLAYQGFPVPGARPRTQQLY